MRFTVPLPRIRSVMLPALGGERRHRLRVNVQEVELPAGATRIGRSPTCNITFDDPLLSREHIEIAVEPDRAVLIDLGSRNGTMVNGAPIEGQVVLRDGDRIRIGKQDIVYSTVVARCAPVRTTARLCRCKPCGQTYVLGAPSCPSCGHRPPPGDWMVREGVIQTAQTDGGDAWVCELNVDVVERAVTLMRFDEAAKAMARVADVVGRGDITPELRDRARLAALRVASASGDAKWIIWTLEDLARVGQVPSPSIVDALDTLPPILLEDALPSLCALVATIGGNGDPTLACDTLTAIADRVGRWRERGADPRPSERVPTLCDHDA